MSNTNGKKKKKAVSTRVSQIFQASNFVFVVTSSNVGVKGRCKGTVKCYSNLSWEHIATLDLRDGETVCELSLSKYGENTTNPAPGEVDSSEEGQINNEQYFLMVKSKAGNSDSSEVLENMALYDVSSLVNNSSSKNSNSDGKTPTFEYVSTLKFNKTGVKCDLVRHQNTILASLPDSDGLVFFKLANKDGGIQRPHQEEVEEVEV